MKQPLQAADAMRLTVESTKSIAEKVVTDMLGFVRTAAMNAEVDIQFNTHRNPDVQNIIETQMEKLGYRVVRLGEDNILVKWSK